MAARDEDGPAREVAHAVALPPSDHGRDRRVGKRLESGRQNAANDLGPGGELDLEHPRVEEARPPQDGCDLGDLGGVFARAASPAAATPW